MIALTMQMPPAFSPALDLTADSSKSAYHDFGAPNYQTGGKKRAR
jgi:hypothetical protein